jgi:Tfp pilus assembly protein PilO
MLVHLFKRYLIWMILSYILAVGLVHIFIILPQKKTVDGFRDEKNRIEYDYMRLKSPKFIDLLDSTIDTAVIKTQNFFWLDSEKNTDAGLVFYNYIYDMTKKAGTELLEVSTLERQSGKKESENYYTWNVKVTGSFNDVVDMIDEIEHNKRFLTLEEITITRGKREDEKVLYDLVLLGLKREAVYDRKNES